MTTTTRATRRYYAIQWTYGRATSTKTGQRIGTYYAFATRADRAAWIADRETDYPGNGGYREAIPSSDAELRAAIRQDVQDEQAGGLYARVRDHGTYIADTEALRDAHLAETMQQAEGWDAVDRD